jgi:hypothetical protein
MSAAEQVVVKFPIKTKLVCSDCGAPGEGSCRCGAPYVTPGERAEAAVKANPEKSDRVISEETGIPHATLSRARKKATVSCETVEKRTGKDGKARKMPTPKSAPSIKAKDDKGRVAGVDIKVDPSIWQEFNEKAQQEQKSATAKIADLITNEIEANSDLRVELPKTAQGKRDAAMRQHQRKLDAEHAARMHEIDEEIRQRVLAETKDYLAEVKEREVAVKKDEKWWQEITNNYKPLFTADHFKTILMCLHPDGQRTPEKLAEAFRLFNSKKLQLTGAKS